MAFMVLFVDRLEWGSQIGAGKVAVSICMMAWGDASGATPAGGTSEVVTWVAVAPAGSAGRLASTQRRCRSKGYVGRRTRRREPSKEDGESVAPALQSCPAANATDVRSLSRLSASVGMVTRRSRVTRSC